MADQRALLNKIMEKNGIPINDFELFVAMAEDGLIDGCSVVEKFGRNGSVGTSYEPVTTNGIYQTPQVSGAVALRVKAGNAADTVDGNGARSVTLVGLDETGALREETINTNGGSAGSASSTTWLRLFRMWVSASGTYATQSAGSHSADVVLETAGAAEWARISSTAFPRGQSQIACYSVPLGKVAFLISYNLSTDTNQSADFAFFKRENILETAAPYTAMRLQFEHVGVKDSKTEEFLGGIQYPALTDIGFMAKASSNADVSVNFRLLVVDL